MFGPAPRMIYLAMARAKPVMPLGGLVADWHAAVAVDSDAGDDDRHGHGVPAAGKCCAAERRAAASQLGSGGASQPGGAR